MDAYQETFATWNKLSALYEQKFMKLSLYNETYDKICQLIDKENPQLLEIGCGPGNITQYLLAKRPDFHIHATDIAPSMVALAQKNNPSAYFSVMDCRDIHTLDMQFDGIIGGFCLPYLSPTDVLKFLDDAQHLLHEQGILYLSFVEGRAEQSGFKVGSEGNRVFFHYHELDTLMANLITRGFGEMEVIHIEYAKSEKGTEIHTILITKKCNPMV